MIRFYHSRFNSSTHGNLIFSTFSRQITEEAALAALHFLSLSTSPDIRIGFNSLCAHASVNHMHWHVYYQAHRLNSNSNPTNLQTCRSLLKGCNSWGHAEKLDWASLHLGKGTISSPGARLVFFRTSECMDRVGASWCLPPVHKHLP